MKYWFTSDYHLGHKNIIKYCNRPFKSLEHMNDTIINNHNSRVRPGDIVYHIGDFCFKNSNDKKGEGVRTKASEWENQLNGKIIFIKGNHDNNNSVKTNIKYLYIETNRKIYKLVHDPNEFDVGIINLVGHVHDNWHIKNIHNTIMYNVGVDVNHFMPISIEEITRNIKRFLKK